MDPNEQQESGLFRVKVIKSVPDLRVFAHLFGLGKVLTKYFPRRNEIFAELFSSQIGFQEQFQQMSRKRLFSLKVFVTKSPSYYSGQGY